MATMAFAAAGTCTATTTTSVCSSSSWSSPSPTTTNSVSSFAPLALKRSFSLKTKSNISSRNVHSARPLAVRATSSSDETAADPNKQFEVLITDVKAKWDKVENKSSVAIYAGGALVTLWLSSTIIGAVNSVPLLPKLLELVGLGYTGWFVYRYLLFKSGRKELVSDVEELKGKITGAADTVTGQDE